MPTGSEAAIPLTMTVVSSGSARERHGRCFPVVPARKTPTFSAGPGRSRRFDRPGASSAIFTDAVCLKRRVRENLIDGSQKALPAHRPVGRLDSEQFYAPLGEMRYDGDRVQCHLCGRWLKIVGGIHIRVAHGITLDQYREMFRLRVNVTTAAPETSKRKRRTMLEQIASSQRVRPYDHDPSERVFPGPPTPGRWRSLAALRPDLSAELHPTRNGDLDPFTVGQHSKRRLWWRCHECGHEREMPVKLRAGKSAYGCPACGRRRSIAATIARNKKPIAPERSLASRHPELLAEWHPTRNGDLDPMRVASGSNRKIWWRCAKCGYEWAAAANDRTRPRPAGCPDCARARHVARLVAIPAHGDSFGARYPQLVPEWHPTLNRDLDPFGIKPGSERAVWWRCAECGREWESAPAVRSRNPTWWLSLLCD